jgi:DnaJ homolog subfamily C member 19
MGLLLIVALVVGWWAYKTRKPQALRIGDVAAVVAALIALRLFKGQPLIGLAALGGAGWWYWFRQGKKRFVRDPGMSHQEARRMLDVRDGATADEIRAAHRRLVARVHPDAGGTAELAARVNAARDVLLRPRT